MEKEKDTKLQTLKDEDIKNLVSKAKAANKANKEEQIKNQELKEEEKQVTVKKQESSKKAKKKNSGITKFLSIVLDILIIPVIIIAFACTILTFSAKANNKVPSIFGMSIVTVLTESMENPNHPNHVAAGEVLVIKKVDPNKIKVGDCVAFYAPKWLGSPFTETIDGEKYSRVIYHQVVRIIYTKSTQNNNERVRHFVLRGINPNLGKMDYVEVPVGEGDYVKQLDGTYKIQEGGNYVAKLEDLVFTNEEDITTDTTQNSTMNTMQYVTDDLVVGIYDNSISPSLGAMINFCGSTKGILCLVIIPALLLTILTIIGLTKEIKKTKEEDELENKVLENTTSEDFEYISKKLNENNQEDKQEEPKEEKAVKEKQDNNLKVLQKESKKAQQATQSKKPDEKPVAEAPASQTAAVDKKAKVASIIDSVVNKETKPNGQQVKTEVKVENTANGPVKTTTTTKTVTTKKTTTTTKVVEPATLPETKPTTPKAAPVKAPATKPAAPATPKAAPVKAPATPKAAPAKAPTAPAKAPAAPAKAPVKAAPKKAEPK